MPTRYKLAFLSESGQRIANERIKEILKYILLLIKIRVLDSVECYEDFDWRHDNVLHFQDSGSEPFCFAGLPTPLFLLFYKLFWHVFGTWNKLETISRNIFHEKNQQ